MFTTNYVPSTINVSDLWLMLQYFGLAVETALPKLDSATAHLLSVMAEKAEDLKNDIYDSVITYHDIPETLSFNKPIVVRAEDK